MPYIKQEHRERLNPLISELAKHVVEISREEDGDGSFAGPLNYSCTRLALEVIRLRFGRIRYWLIAIVTGVFSNVSGEFYRRLATPYEDKQIENHGDLDLYKEFFKDTEGQ